VLGSASSGAAIKPAARVVELTRQLLAAVQFLHDITPAQGWQTTVTGTSVAVQGLLRTAESLHRKTETAKRAWLSVDSPLTHRFPSWRRATVVEAIARYQEARHLLTALTRDASRALSRCEALADALPVQRYKGLAVRVLKVAVSSLPPTARTRWLDDWYGELSTLPRSQRARFAWQMLRGMPRMAWVLRRPTVQASPE
jgi:hypothetical protein